MSEPKVPYHYKGWIKVLDMDGKEIHSGILQHVGPGYYMIGWHPDGAGTEIRRMPYPHQVEVQGKIYVVEEFDGDPEADFNPFGFYT